MILKMVRFLCNGEVFFSFNPTASGHGKWISLKEGGGGGGFGVFFSWFGCVMLIWKVNTIAKHFMPTIFHQKSGHTYHTSQDPEAAGISPNKGNAVNSLMAKEDKYERHREEEDDEESDPGTIALTTTKTGYTLFIFYKNQIRGTSSLEIVQN